ncbi:MAG TPA: response regulator [Gammaproteobacteria bacterium]|nr:response regulator [Gammaproteobacteria bacterium]
MTTLGCHRVLVVEDHEDTRESLTLLLEAKGYTVDSAQDGREALTKLRDGGAPCLVLLDLHMPGMSGWQLRRELLEDEALASLPVILLSGEADLEDSAAKLNVTAHLKKPVALDKLYRLLEKYC